MVEVTAYRFSGSKRLSEPSVIYCIDNRIIWIEIETQTFRSGILVSPAEYRLECSNLSVMISSERIAQAITGAKSTCGGLPFPLDGYLAINEKNIV